DSPIRFREDANTEEDLALGGYRDRVVVELAQNAADAAIRAGVRGRLLLRLAQTPGGPVLLAANTGSPLDARGVQALCTLRASDKALPADPSPAFPEPLASSEPFASSEPPASSEPFASSEPPASSEPDPLSASTGGGAGPAGRFGVGFSAVLALTDEPAVVCRAGGVRFSAADTRDLVHRAAEENNDLGTELARRDDHVPVLRLPFPTEGCPPDGYDTAVLLPLRDAAARELTLRLLQETGDPLLLALPGLDQILIEVPDAEPRLLSRVEDRWWVLHEQGRMDPALLADRPTEERRRTGWSVSWALPRDGDTAGLPGVLHCPTPSDEPLAWPALLIASFPLDPSRRHVAQGPAADHIVAMAALAYARLVAQRAAAGDQALDLLPDGLPAGPLDARLRTALGRLLSGTALLASAEDPHRLLCPPQAVALDFPSGADRDVVEALAGYVDGLVHAPRRSAGVLAELKVRRVGLGEVLEQLPGTMPSEDRRRLYTALARLAGDPLIREELSGLPIPLSDGRVVRGARGLLLPGGSPVVAAALARLGVRVVRPDAVDPLLETLGALPLSLREALRLPVVRAVVTASPEDHEALGPDALGSDGLWEPTPGGPRNTGTGSGTDPQGLPDPDLEVTDAVLTLVAQAADAGELLPGDLPWLADLALADSDGELTPAGALALPGSAAERLMDPAEIGVVDEDLLRRWGRRALAAVGVLDGFATLHWDELPLDADLLDLLVESDSRPGTAGPWGTPPLGPDSAGYETAGYEAAGGEGTGGDPRDLDGWREWTEDLLQEASSRLSEPVRETELTLLGFSAVRDLDAVRPDAWADALEELLGDPVGRAAVLDPQRVLVRGDGPVRTLRVPGYTAWWLRRRWGGGTGWADPTADPELVQLLPPGPAPLVGLDRRARAALGAVRTVAELDRTTVIAVVRALSDPGVPVGAATALRLWDGLGLLAAEGTLDVDPPSRVRVLDGEGTQVVDADDAVVVDSPALLQRTDLGRAVVARREAAEGLAELLDLPLAGDLAPGKVDELQEPGRLDEVPAAVRELLPLAPSTWCEHDRLMVDGVEVDWWVDESGTVHASTFDGLAQALAWAGDAWHRRGAVATVLTEPDLLAEVAAQEVFGPA
ncbi:MAG: hypothetical protein QG608_1201, partial [Actinomycetota bacterium]|nr:hypothetical protein [Actinomycetota bacterium]